MISERHSDVSPYLAVQFDQYMKEYQGLYWSLAQKTKTYVSPSIHTPVLVDLGTGPGLFSIALHQCIPSAVLVGVDPSPPMLQLAVRNTRESAITQFIPVVGKAEKLPFKDASVDCVVGRFCLLYWQTPQAGCQEIYRVLKPGGRLILDTMNAEFPRWRLWMMLRQMRRQGADRTIIQYQRDAYAQAYTQAQITQFLSDAQYTVLEVEGKKTDWKFLVAAEKPA